MIFSNSVIKNILDLKDEFDVSLNDMSQNMKVTFFPYHKKSSEEIENFSTKLREAFIKNGVEVIPYNDALIVPPIGKTIKHILRITASNIRMIFKKDKYFFKIRLGKKIKKGIAIIMPGDGYEGNMPMDNTISFKFNPIITIINRPDDILPNSSFYEHMDFALDKFAWHMTNLIVAVTKDDFTIYSFNASYPTYKINDEFNNVILSSLIPKIAAPVRPPEMKDFIIHEGKFNPRDNFYKKYIDDIIESGPIFEKTGLYPKGKKINDLRFKNNFYRWVGSLHLDGRNGMSYGFLARQLPSKLSSLYDKNNSPNFLLKYFKNDVGYFKYGEDSYLLFKIKDSKYILKVPDVWVLTSRSGSNKTKLDIDSDIIKMGLIAGRVVLELPKSYKETKSRPSFDTKVILAHAVGNVIFASILKHFNSSKDFVNRIENSGVAIAHWHGYVNPAVLEDGWNIYGNNMPSVSCSSPQSALYAFQGKENGLLKCLQNNIDYLGDVHIEPHHGTNIIYKDLVSLANFLIRDKVSSLGDKYLIK